MQKIIIFMCLCVMLLVSMADANTVWNPAGNPVGGIYPPDVGLWSDPNNWNGGSGLYPGIGPGEDPKAVFNVLNPAECQVFGHRVTGTLVMGDNGPEDPHNAVLRIMPGATLEITGTSSWTAIGYNRDAGTVIVEEGALLDNNAHLYIGMQVDTDPAGGIGAGKGRLIINGGTVLVADTFRYGRNDGTEGSCLFAFSACRENIFF